MKNFSEMSTLSQEVAENIDEQLYDCKEDCKKGRLSIKVNTKITKKGKIKITNLDNFLLYRIVKVFYFI